MTLKELLKDQKLPCKITNESGTTIYEMHYVNEIWSLGFDDSGKPSYFLLSNDGFKLYTEPRRLVKKKMYAPIAEYKDRTGTFICGTIFNSKEKALSCSGLSCSENIGVQEIEVEVYE